MRHKMKLIYQAFFPLSTGHSIIDHFKEGKKKGCYLCKKHHPFSKLPNSLKRCLKNGEVL